MQLTHRDGRTQPRRGAPAARSGPNGYSRRVLSRRRLLLGIAAGATAAQAGCTLDPDVAWLPAATPSPLAIAGAQAAADRAGTLAARAATLRTKAAAWKLDEAQVRALGWFESACDDHARVLASADPARRQTTAPPAVTPPPTPADARAGYAGITEALDGDVTGHRTRALAADGAAALLWAGLAAFTATMNDRLPSGTFTGANDPATTTPALTGEDWGRRLLVRSYEARYALQSVLAAPGLTAAQRGQVRRGLSAWVAVRDALTDRRRAEGADVPPAEPAYQVTMPASRRQAWALGARVQGQALPEVGAWVANADSTARPWAVDLLVATSRSAVAFGAPALRWPGWSG